MSKRTAPLILIGLILPSTALASGFDDARELHLAAGELRDELGAAGRTWLEAPGGVPRRLGDEWTNRGPDGYAPGVDDVVIEFDPPVRVVPPRHPDWVGSRIAPDSPGPTWPGPIPTEAQHVPFGSDRAFGVATIGRILWNALRPSKLGDGTHDGQGNPTNPRER